MKRTIVVGDIHGCYHELLTLLEKTGLRDEDLLISVGDLVDRGNKSREVWKYFMDRPNTITLMGNHERKHLQGVLNYAQEIVKVQMGNEYPQFLAWAMTLPYYYETDEAIIVHAAMEHDLPLHEQRQDILSGTTSGERHLEKKYSNQHTELENPVKAHWTDHYTGKKPVIYGHSVSGDLPRIVNNTYGIDTGACHGGYLTAIELPGFIIHQVKVTQDHWKAQIAEWQLPVLKSKDWDNMEISAIHKEIAGRAYKASPAVQEFLHEKKSYLALLDLSLTQMKAQLDLFAITHKDHLHEFPFKTFLYKSRSGTLTLADLRKSLHTPARITQLQHLLSDSILIGHSHRQ
ncbi:metallophosphoesterase [Chitinophaga sancti]|uniref:Metallophosphoesterase n=1 Tax=Chitinophaga sancti TaxID=1004 RepID=A0A1K1RNL9_9BACT|nr:metallophosphoesterase [Chitinophaga sancti]WQD62568.1 metallophosphoesterase [Chitinophaga sancti]WQG91863.1 metallophosphoesterase [Chitinophaga sancti]SFW73851.1 serine/threonine protein phosphatase 1 [Chitinophaga sancti]